MVGYEDHRFGWSRAMVYMDKVKFNSFTDASIWWTTVNVCRQYRVNSGISIHNWPKYSYCQSTVLSAMLLLLIINSGLIKLSSS